MIKRRINYRISNILLFIYLCIPFFNAIIERVFSMFGLGEDLALWPILAVLYGGYVWLCIKRRRLLAPDFWVIYIALLLFLGITYVVHPEYEPWYTRSDYGVLNYVLKPSAGLYIYLFIRLVDDPKQILKTIKISAIPMYLYFGLSVVEALRRGYWIDISNKGYERFVSYNLSLGYNVLIFVLPFIYDFLEKKKPLDFLGSAIGVFIILIAGSRGPFLDLGIFLILYLMLKISNPRTRLLVIFACLVGGVLLYFAYPYILAGLAKLLEALHISSRFLTKLMSGTITDDNHRGEIWAAALRMIRSRPLGYGAMGSRHVLYRYIYVAHPHDFFLEVLIDYGVIIGTLIILWLGHWTVRLFRMKGMDDWKACFLVFFARACQLLVSLTYWHSIGLWGALAVGVCMYRASKGWRRVWQAIAERSM